MVGFPSDLLRNNCMFRQLRYIIATLTLGIGSLSASICSCPGEWEIKGEFLYLRPSVDDTYFVIQGTGVETRRRNNDFTFHPGFRVDGTYIFGLC